MTDNEILPAASPPPGMTLHQLPTGTYETRGSFAIRGGSFRDRRAFASTALLVRHPCGDLLIDAGFGARADEHIASLPSFRRSPHTRGRIAAEQLAAAGLDPASLAGVLLTHSHWDHVSGLDSIPAPIRITAEEEAYARASRADTVFAQVATGHRIEHYTFDGPAHLGFAASHDVHGDGSIVVVPSPGHTSGSVVVFVTLPTGRRYAFVGDLTWQHEGVSEGRERPWLMRRLADTDPGRIRDDLARVRALPAAYHVVPAHDVAAYEGIPLLAPVP